MRTILQGMTENKLKINNNDLGIEYYNHGQKSFVALFHMHQTNTCVRIHLHLFRPPSYKVGHMYMLFLQSFNIVLGDGGGGGEATHFKTDNSAF